jgi:hypothetical protein
LVLTGTGNAGPVEAFASGPKGSDDMAIVEAVKKARRSIEGRNKEESMARDGLLRQETGEAVIGMRGFKPAYERWRLTLPPHPQKVAACSMSKSTSPAVKRFGMS